MAGGAASRIPYVYVILTCMRQGDWGTRNMMKLGIAILEAREKLEKERKEKK